jgi:tRNA A-37 threonylcarbamoyl transferase component Bud32
MGSLEIHPRYQDLLSRLGLTTARDFLALQGVVCSGHPDRHVVRLTLGEGEGAVRVLLKREHRTRWRDRFVNAWAGYGLASKSRREFTILRALHDAPVGAPEALATGEDDDGRAFLLIRELEGYRDLRQFLVELAPASYRKRCRFSRFLGSELARLHFAGFVHCDLYAKHVLVQRTSPPDCFSLRLVDWQRAKERKQVTWPLRWRDLAALDATIADDLASPRDRLRFLSKYLRYLSGAGQSGRMKLATAARQIRQMSTRLLERRRIREMREPPLTAGEQNLIWLDGEALFVTQEFHREMEGRVPDWLKDGSSLESPYRSMLSRSTVPLPNSRLAHLVTRAANLPWQWLWSGVSRRQLVAPELESMKVLFRLQRYGVAMPRLLAAGQRRVKPWRIQSFLLTEPIQESTSLPRFLSKARASLKRGALRKAAQVIRQMHQANCYFSADRHDTIGELLGVQQPMKVALTSVQGVEQCHHRHPARAQRDLAALARALGGHCTQTDLLRGLLAYIDQPRLTPATRHFARNVLRRLRQRTPSRRVAA